MVSDQTSGHADGPANAQVWQPHPQPTSSPVVRRSMHAYAVPLRSERSGLSAAERTVVSCRVPSGRLRISMCQG